MDSLSTKFYAVLRYLRIVRDFCSIYLINVITFLKEVKTSVNNTANVKHEFKRFLGRIDCVIIKYLE